MNGGGDKLNANPTIYNPTVRGHSDIIDDFEEDTAAEAIDALEVFGGSPRGMPLTEHELGVLPGLAAVRDALGQGCSRPGLRADIKLIRHLNDPEHPLTLEQLNVTTLENVHVDDAKSTDVYFTPTIPHCSMATLIGLCIRVKLLRSLPRRFKVTVRITPGAHSSEAAVNKQLNDKERVAAALENAHLLEVVNKCIARTDKIDDILARHF